jgi:hypothetical protein
MKKAFFTIILPLIINALLAIYLFVLADKKREPVYSVTNSPSLIFDKKNASTKIKLSINDSIPIKDNVYVTTIALWNKGKLPIENGDLREAFYAYSQDSLVRILDYKISKEREIGISNFKLIPIENRLKIDWDHFDPGYGCYIQIIYSGGNQTKFQITGSTIDVKVKQVVSAQKGVNIEKLFFILLVFTSIFMAVFAWTKSVRLFYESSRSLSRLFIICALAGMLLMVYLIFKDEISSINVPF